MGCYLDPDTRSSHPSESRFARHNARSPADGVGLTDDEIAALPVQLLGDEDPQPDPPGPPEREAKKVGDYYAAWVDAAPAAHPDTDPEAIRAAQAADVADAMRRLGPGATAEAVSAETMLPLWNVRRIMGEAGE